MTEQDESLPRDPGRRRLFQAVGAAGVASALPLLPALATERYGKDFLGAEYTFQDWGVSYADLEPYYDRAAYADGRRDNEVMTPIARQLAPEQRTALSAYYSELRARAGKPPASAVASARGRALAMRGDQALHVQGCQNCHGPGGTGFGNVNPYLAGLDRRYLEMALGEWKSGSRKTDLSQQMNQIAKNLSDQDIKALAAYYASQPPPQPATVASPKPRIGMPAERTRPGTAMTPREGTGVTGGEPSGSQGPGGAGSK